MSVAKSSSSPASADILVRELDGVAIWSWPPNTDNQPNTKLEKVPCTSANFSQDGSKLMVKSKSSISIYDGKTFEVVKSFAPTNILAASLSPRGTYLQTFQTSSSPQEKNVTLWKTTTGESVYTLSQKNMTPATWPTIKFSSDEAVASRMAKDKLEFFDMNDFSKGAVRSITIPGIASAELSKNGSHVAAFIPESKRKRRLARVQIYACADSQSVPVAGRSVVGGSSVQQHWNNGSTGLLVAVQADADKTGEGSYEEGKLYYLTVDGYQNSFVHLFKDGPLHDVQWSCSGDEFAVVYGFMPAMATIYDKKCKPLLELGTGPYNTIRWNPKGSLILVAGYGNLPGDMAFWDYAEKKHIISTKYEWSLTSKCSTKPESVRSEWSPDGRYFLTATTAPGQKVQNGMKIFNCDGTMCFEEKFEKLYQVDWKADSPDNLGDIEEPVKSAGSLEVASKPQGQESKSSQAPPVKPINPQKKPAAYESPQANSAAAKEAELFKGTTSLL